ncbi:helix-turn-helix domain-containing protein [Longispora albida]|uniref:helix-turn-helix domain-containing protein n=1 Tax=Longispora albida TaxID=203523 RepID=UPI00039BAACC|nr:helix-turn-helix domain-containing protein [Longispora albida]
MDSEIGGLETAGSPAEFVALLRVLRQRSGLTYRQITARSTAAGDPLAPSTLAGMLNRSNLPGRAKVVTLVTICGGEACLPRWLAAYDRLASASVQHSLPGASTEPAPAGAPARDPGPRAGTRLRAAALACLFVLIGLAIGNSSPPPGGPVARHTPAPESSRNTAIRLAAGTDGSIGLGPSHCASTNPWGELCIRVTRTGATVFQIEGSIGNSTPHCSMALMVSGTAPSGTWYGDAKRTPCGVASGNVFSHTYVWKHAQGVALKPETRLCVQAGIYTGNSPQPTDWHRNKACVWLSVDPQPTGETGTAR